MEIDEEVRRKTIVSISAVAVFLAALIGVGVFYDGGDALPEAGAVAIVGLLVAFVFLMAVVGFYLDRTE